MKGEKQAADESQAYVLRYLKYAERLAKRFYAEHHPMAAEFEDIVAAAYLGLCDAAQRFDSQKGVSFKTFSYFRIRGEMYDLLRRHSCSQRRRSSNIAAKEVTAEVMDEAGNEQSESPTRAKIEECQTIERVCEELGVVIRGVNQDLQLELSYLNIASPGSLIEEESVSAYLRAEIDRLPPVERRVVQLKYYQNFSYSEMSKMMSGTQKSSLCRLHKRAIKRMRERVATEQVF